MINNPSTSSESIVRFDKCKNDEASITNTASVIVQSNNDRNYAVFVNNSSVDITLILGTPSEGSIKKGIILKARGGSYEITSMNLFTGTVSAVASASVKLSFVEC